MKTFVGRIHARKIKSVRLGRRCDSMMIKYSLYIQVQSNNAIEN